MWGLCGFSGWNFNHIIYHIYYHKSWFATLMSNLDIIHMLRGKKTFFDCFLLSVFPSKIIFFKKNRKLLWSQLSFFFLFLFFALLSILCSSVLPFLAWSVGIFRDFYFWFSAVVFPSLKSTVFTTFKQLYFIISHMPLNMGPCTIPLVA